VSQRDLIQLARHLNDQRRKCLGYKTPAEVFVAGPRSGQVALPPLRTCFRIDVATTMSRVRNCLLPRLDFLPSRSLPPLNLARGVIPI
jgi:hypothetical protein